MTARTVEVEEDNGDFFFKNYKISWCHVKYLTTL